MRMWCFCCFCLYLCFWEEHLWILRNYYYVLCSLGMSWLRKNQYSSVVILQLTLPVYFEYFCLFVCFLLLLLFSLCLSESLTSSSTDQACSRMQHPRALRASTSGQPHWPTASTPALVRAPATVQRQSSYAGMPMSFATQETGSGSGLRPCSTEAGQVTVAAEPGRWNMLLCVFFLLIYSSSSAFPAMLDFQSGE